MENKKRKDGKTSSRILTGVLVCFVLIAVYGIATQLKVSYAFPDTLEEIDSNNVEVIYPKQVAYTPGVPKDDTQTANWYAPSKKIVGNIKMKNQANPSYSIDIFCLDKSAIMPDTTINGYTITYKNRSTDSQEIVDEGINYIVLKAYNDNDLTETTDAGVKTVHLADGDYYDAQMALWIYQAKPNQNNNPQLTDNDLKTIWNSVYSSHGSGSDAHAKKIYEYVTGAQEAYANRNVQNAITLNGKVEFKLNSDETYYETENLTVSITKAPNTEFSGFKLSLSNDSQVDIAVVDSSNNVIQPSDYATKIGGGQSFKFRIKKDDLPTNTTVGITGQIKGNFKHMGFKAYRGYLDNEAEPDEDLQVILVPVTESKTKSIDIEASVTVPDTGAGFSGYIYIIGALVLIVGLTIIYVNTKVQEN